MKSQWDGGCGKNFQWGGGGGGSSGHRPASVGELFFWPWALTRGDLTVELSEVLGAFQIR